MPALRPVHERLESAGLDRSAEVGVEELSLVAAEPRDRPRTGEANAWHAEDRGQVQQRGGGLADDQPGTAYLWLNFSGRVVAEQGEAIYGAGAFAWVGPHDQAEPGGCCLLGHPLDEAPEIVLGDKTEVDPWLGQQDDVIAGNRGSRGGNEGLTDAAVHPPTLRRAFIGCPALAASNGSGR